jgi:hypothetical protein
MTVLSDVDIVFSETESEGDEEDTVVSLIHLVTLELSLIANRQCSWKRDRGLGSNISSGSSCVISLDVVYSCSSFYCSSNIYPFSTLFPNPHVIPGITRSNRLVLRDSQAAYM